MAALKAFILDPSTATRNIAGPLRDLAEHEFSWNCEQIAFEDTQRDSVATVPRIVLAIEEAEVLIGLGSFFLFAWGGDGFGDQFVDRILARMKGGMPALFQLPRFFDRLRSGQIPERTQRILRYCEVLSTNNRVYSETDAYDGHTSPMTPWFRKADGCLLDSQIFRGIEAFLMSSVNLFEYSGDTFPIAEAGPLHRFVDAGDLPSRGILGRKNAVGLVRRTEDEFSIFLGGQLLNAPTETMGGHLPGIDANRGVAIRLLEALNDAAQGRLPLNRAYAAFYALETSLGEVVEATLNKAAKGGPIESFFPANVAENIRSKGGFNYSLATYTDLSAIVLSNWTIFKTVFDGISKTRVKQTLEGINYKYRRHLAHPHKAAQEGVVFATDDVEEIRAAHELVKTAKAALLK